MERKISIQIGGRTFNLTATSPEHEEMIRLAADAINKRLASYLQRNPGKNAAELMSMVALNECVLRISFQREVDKAKAEGTALSEDLGRYLEEDKK